MLSPAGKKRAPFWTSTPIKSGKVWQASLKQYIRRRSKSEPVSPEVSLCIAVIRADRPPHMQFQGSKK